MITIITTLLSKYWRTIASCLAIILALMFVYNIVYQRGVVATTVAYEAKLAAQQALLDEHIAQIEHNSTVLIKQNEISAKATRQDLAKILAAAKTKPLVVYKNGECIPSKTFLDSWNQINLRGNQK